MLLSYTGLCCLCLSTFQWQPVGGFGFRLLQFRTLSPDSPQYRALLPWIIVCTGLVIVALPVALAGFSCWNIGEGRSNSSWLRNSKRLSGRQALLLQLMAMYRPECWWMASYSLVRILLLVALLSTVNEAWLWIWLTLANYLLLARHLSVLPYERAIDNDEESIALLSLSVQSNLLSACPPPYLSPALLAIFNTLVVVALLPLILRGAQGQLAAVRQVMNRSQEPLPPDSSSDRQRIAVATL